MMALPFLVLLGAIVLAWTGRRIAGLAVWGAALVLTAVLFRLHATDVLKLDF